VAISAEQAERERDHLIEKHLEENANQRCTRLAHEEEFIRGNTKLAEAYLLELLKNQEGDAKIMQQIAQFYLRGGKQDKAEAYLKDAFAFSMQNDNDQTNEIALSYACLLC